MHHIFQKSSWTPPEVLHHNSGARKLRESLSLFIVKRGEEKKDPDTRLIKSVECKLTLTTMRLLEHLVLKPCESGCPQDTVMVNYNHPELGSQHTELTFSDVVKEGRKISFKPEQKFQDLLAKWTEKEGVFPELMVSEYFDKVCFYCGLSRCNRNHFGLKLAMLLHRHECWFQVSEGMHMSIPLRTLACGTEKLEEVFFVLSLGTKKDSLPKCQVLTRKIGGKWEEITDMKGLVDAEAVAKTFCHCQRKSPKRLFHKASAECSRRGFVKKLRSLQFPWDVQSVEKGFEVLLQNLNKETGHLQTTKKRCKRLINTRKIVKRHHL